MEKIMVRQVLDNNLRYERKFMSSAKYNGYLDNLLKFICNDIYETYPQRRVNSIYYDTDCFKFASQNIEGYKERSKIRIRFYGNVLNKNDIFLEQKNKFGDVGNKQIKALINQNNLEYNYNNLSKDIILNNPNNYALEKFIGIKPKLFCSYNRQYFETACKNYRFTIDRDIKFGSFIGKNKLKDALKYLQKTDKEIIEFKYSIENEMNANKIIKDLPLRVTKSSKYISGLYTLGIIESN